jgi:hypothetical protein
MDGFSGIKVNLEAEIMMDFLVRRLASKDVIVESTITVPSFSFIGL